MATTTTTTTTTAGTPPAFRSRSVLPGFRGWWVIAGLFLMLMTSAGFGFYGLSVYLRVLHDERGFSITAMSFATGVFFLVAGFFSIFIGRLLRRFDPRPIVAVGALVSAASIVGIGRAAEIWQVYLLYAAFGAGFACCSLTISTTLVARWFDRKRSVALGIASTGLSVGGIVVTPRAKSLLLDHGLGGGTNRVAIAFVVLIALFPMFLLQPDPRPLGLAPDGDPVVAGDTPPPLNGVDYETARRSPFFIAVTVIFALGLLAQVGGIAQLFSVVSERTNNKSAAGLTVSTLAFAGVVGRLVGGFVLPRVGSRRFAIGSLLLQGLGLAWVASVHTKPLMLIGAVFFGLAMGNVLLLHPLLLAETFGVKEYGRIYSLSQAGTNIGVAIGPFLLGALRDHGGGYAVSYTVAAVISLASSAALWRFLGRANPARSANAVTA